MNIVFISSEAYPFAKTGGLGDYSYSLPKALSKKGYRVSLFLPRYYSIDKVKFRCRIIGKPLAVPHDGGIRWAGIYRSDYVDGMNVYFIEHDDFYGRDGLYEHNGIPYVDNAHRFIYFNRACLESLKQLAIVPDIIHCNDWQTAMVPLLLKIHYSNDTFFTRTKTVLTIHNVGYQGVFKNDILHTLQISENSYYHKTIDFFGKINFLKAGIAFSDIITTVSKRYAEEIQLSEYGYDLSEDLKLNSYKLSGILNGVDYEHWNPEKDRLIPYNYTSVSLEGKMKCKEALQEYFMMEKSSMPIIGSISRLTYQKGIDTLVEVLEWLLTDDIHFQFVMLGSGEQWLIDRFETIRNGYPGRVGLWWGYNEELAHLIEAGSDFYVMPSRYEPSGLNQMYSMAYGTIPIVRATGGLDDTITEFDKVTGTGNGFKFHNNSTSELYSVIRYALRLYRNTAVMTALRKNAMHFKRSWDDSAHEYEKLYYSIL